MFLYENIQTLRLINRYTQEYLASKLGVTQSYYSRIEHKELDLPISMLLKIKELYSVPIETLLFVNLANQAISKDSISDL